MIQEVRIIQMEILGTPVAQERPKVSTVGGVRLYDPPKSAAFKQQVRKIAQIEKKKREIDFLEGPLEAYIYCYFPIPKSKSKSFRQAAQSGTEVPQKKPDCDNLAKGVLDACNGVLYQDDAQITRLYVEKLYGLEPKMVVTIAEQGTFRWED